MHSACGPTGHARTWFTLVAHADVRRHVPAAPASPPVAETSLGLSRKRAALLAYSAGWVTGLLVLWLEGRDRDTRWHAAQSVLGFGALTVLGCACLGVAASGSCRRSRSSASASGRRRASSSSACCCGLWSMAQVALGGTPRWPLIGARVDRLADPS